MTASSGTAVPEALLLIAPGCSHCPVVLEALGALVKEATIGRLEVVNIAAQPERAQSLGVRSVPWTRIGAFELEGLRSLEELRRWAKQAGTGEGMAAYLDELFKAGQRQKVENMVRRQPTYLRVLVDLLGGDKTSINTRIGVMATFEELQGSGLSTSVVKQLGELTGSSDARIRTDACHALSLTENADALPYLQERLADPDPDVKEAAQEAIDSLVADQN